MKTEWTMTDDEWEKSLAQEVEEAEKQAVCKSARQFEQECERIWKEIEQQCGYV